MCGGDAFTADDIAQDACVKAWIALDSFRGASKLSTWLFRIAYNSWCDRKYSFPGVDIDAARQVEDDSRSDSAFEYQPLYQAIAMLKPQEKAAILLFYMEERSIKEISAIMGVPTGTVKSLLSRGRNRSTRPFKTQNRPPACLVRKNRVYFWKLVQNLISLL